MGQLHEIGLGILTLFLFTLSAFSILPLIVVFSINGVLAALIITKQYRTRDVIKQVAQWSLLIIGIVVINLILEEFSVEHSKSILAGVIFFSLALLAIVGGESFTEFLASQILSIISSSVRVYAARSPSMITRWANSIAIGQPYSDLEDFYDYNYRGCDITLRFITGGNASIFTTNSSDFLSSHDRVTGEGICISCRDVGEHQLDIRGVARGNGTYVATVTDLSICRECYEESVKQIIEETDLTEEKFLANRI